MHKDTKILPVGSIVIAKKDLYMENTKKHDDNKFLTKNKDYTIIAPPLYYNYPIIIKDNHNHEHHCPPSFFI